MFYTIQTSSFEKMNLNMGNIHNSEARLHYVIDITLRTRTLVTLNQNMLNLTEQEK